MAADRIERTEFLTEGPAQALAGLLDTELDGDGSLPLLWHWVYLLDRPRQSDLGPDGHPLRGGLPAPPGRGQRRMFAGGRVTRRGPLLLNRSATRTTTAGPPVVKSGRSGELTFVTLTTEIGQDGAVVIVEEQNLVYLSSPAADGARLPNAAEEPGAVPPGRSITVDPTVLFRFSALTYNTHRIHYDRPWAQDVEGYADLVVHGPLQAILMAEAGRARLGRTCRQIDFRLLSPLLVDQGMLVDVQAGSGDHFVVTVSDRTGRPTASAGLIAG